MAASDPEFARGSWLETGRPIHEQSLHEAASVQVPSFMKGRIQLLTCVTGVFVIMGFTFSTKAPQQNFSAKGQVGPNAFLQDMPADHVAAAPALRSLQAVQEFFVRTGRGANACPQGYNHITDASKCAQAANALGMSWKRSDRWGYIQPNCFIDSNNQDVYFNTDTSGNADSTVWSICQLAVQTAYVQTDRGSKACPQGYKHITDASECAQAASALGMSWKISAGWGYIQPNCFIDSNHRDVYFNTDTSGNVDSLVWSVCQQEDNIDQAEGWQLIETNIATNGLSEAFKWGVTLDQLQDYCLTNGFKLLRYDSGYKRGWCYAEASFSDISGTFAKNHHNWWKYSEKPSGQRNFPADLMPACPGGAALTTKHMSAKVYDEIVDSVRKQLQAVNPKCNNDECPQSDWAGCVLRMAGHDFMDFVPNQGGGSDGCVDFDDVDNKGLKPCLVTGEFGKSLSTTYLPVCKDVSLADFFVIAAEAVMMETREHAGTGLGKLLDFRSRFQYGRTTSMSCPSAKGRLPNPEEGCAATERVFNRNMGLTWALSTALMGVHTLGRAQTENSGYNGWWTDAENSRKFNNDYYISMLSKSWLPVSLAKNKHQWDRNDVGKTENGKQHEMMLNTDLCLAFKFRGGAHVGAKEALHANECKCLWLRSSNFTSLTSNKWCGGNRGSFGDELNNCCPTGGLSCDDIFNPTGVAIDAVKKYASDEAVWLQDFIKAWAIATTNGFSNLKPLAP